MESEMVFAGTNYLAILIAAIAAFVFGALYYGALAEPWKRAAGISTDLPKPGASGFVLTFIAELAMAWIMAGLIGHLGPGQVTLKNGLISAGIIWFGFLLTSTTISHRYQGKPWRLTLIDAGHWLGVALILGGVIGGLGV